MDIELHVVARLVTAAALGAFVGIEREASDQPAGLRTHLTVAVGAALFGIISTEGFDEYVAIRRDTNVQVDVTRVASTVVTGIGFLGAGMIFRRGNTVHNLTTAASLWVVAAIGLSCGVGDLAPAAVASLALLIGLAALRPPRRWIRNRLSRDHEPIRIVLADGQAKEPALAALTTIEGVSYERLSVQKESGAYVILAECRADRGVDLRERLSALAIRDDIRTLRVGTLSET